MRFPQFFSDQNTSQPRKTVSRKRKLLLLRTYLPDWIVTIVLFGLFYLLDRVNGFRRTFDINDTSLHHSYAVHERIPNWALFVICAVAPAVIILFVSLLIVRSVWDWHSGWLGLLLSLAVTSTATNIIKICVGRPRPDILDRCQPPVGINNPTPYTLSDSSICTRTDLLNDGFRSFPSGHSSLSFCGLIYLTLYLSGKMHISNEKGLSVKTWILLAPVIGATLVGISRSMDYRHHATDIIAGSLLGLFIGWYCYRQYYPALSHPLCHRPYSPRIPREVDDDPEAHRHAGTHEELTRLGTNATRNGGSSPKEEHGGIRVDSSLSGSGEGGGGMGGGVPLEEGRPMEVRM